MIVKDDLDNDKIKVGSGSLSNVAGVATNTLLNNGFETETSTGVPKDWHFTSTSGKHGEPENELWNSGSIFDHTTASVTAVGTNCFEIFIQPEQTSQGGGNEPAP